MDKFEIVKDNVNNLVNKLNSWINKKQEIKLDISDRIYYSNKKEIPYLNAYAKVILIKLDLLRANLTFKYKNNTFTMYFLDIGNLEGIKLQNFNTLYEHRFNYILSNNPDYTNIIKIIQIYVQNKEFLNLSTLGIGTASVNHYKNVIITELDIKNLTLSLSSERKQINLANIEYFIPVHQDKNTIKKDYEYMNVTMHFKYNLQLQNNSNASTATGSTLPNTIQNNLIVKQEPFTYKQYLDLIQNKSVKNNSNTETPIPKIPSVIKKDKVYSTEKEKRLSLEYLTLPKSLRTYFINFNEIYTQYLTGEITPELAKEQLKEIIKTKFNENTLSMLVYKKESILVETANLRISILEGHSVDDFKQYITTLPELKELILFYIELSLIPNNRSNEVKKGIMQKHHLVYANLIQAINNLE